MGKELSCQEGEAVEMAETAGQLRGFWEGAVQWQDERALRSCEPNVELSVIFLLFCIWIFSKRRRRLSREKESWPLMPVTRWKLPWSRWTGSLQVRAGNPTVWWLVPHTWETVFSHFSFWHREKPLVRFILFYCLCHLFSKSTNF